MTKLADFINKYPEVYLMAGHDDLTFINRLERAGLISHTQWSELLAEIAGLRGIAVPPEEEEAGLRARVGIALFNKIAPFFTALAAKIWDGFLGLLAPAFILLRDVWRRTGQGIIETHANFYRGLVTIEPSDPPAIRKLMDEFREKPSLMGGFWILLYRVGYGVGYAMSLIPIVSKDAVRSLNKEYSPALPDISTLVTYYYKYPSDLELVYEKAAEQGFEKSEVDLYIAALKALFPVDNLRDLYLRGLIDDDTLKTQLRRAGWDDTSIDQLKELCWVIPGPTDLVSMSVREAWRDEYAERWGSDEDRPEGLYEWGPKVGLSDYWIKRFWRAHWNIPSVLQGFEMLHRGEITPEELNDLLKALDIMPGWREKLIAISYRTLTRVDVRRMYKTGTLDREGVKRAYLDVGYNDKNAELMTDFTIKWVTDDERDLTKADILGAYQRRLFDASTASRALTDMGYDASEVALLISRIDYDLAKKKKTSRLKNLEKGYKKGVYTSDRVQGRMQEMGMSGAEITELINLWDAETKDDTRSLSRADFDALRKKRIIDETVYREELAKLKYTERDIDWLVKLHG